MNDRVLVIGSTRGTGSLIANRLLQHGCRVRAVARNEAQAKRKLGAGVEVVAANSRDNLRLPEAQLILCLARVGPCNARRFIW